MLEHEPTSVPYSEHMEVAILGTMLLDPVAVEDARAILRPADFFVAAHQLIFRAILVMAEKHIPIDTMTVEQHLRDQKQLEAVGGLSYLLHLSDGTFRNNYIAAYAKTVKDKSRLRAVMNVAEMSYRASGDQGDDAETVLERTIEQLQLIREDSDDFGLDRVGDFLAAEGDHETAIERLSTVHGINFGFAQLDETIGGAQPEDLIIIAARPSMGKTALMANIGWNVSVKDSRNAAVFSLEQPKKAIIRRMLSSASRIEYKAIRTGELRPQDRTLIMERREMLSKAPLYMTDARGMTLSRIRSKCLKLDRDIRSRTNGKEKLDLILIDQLSKMSGDDVYRKGMQMREVIGKQTGGLKMLAKELGLPVVLLCQLRRADKGSSVKRPTLEDLKESGNIEEDADVVALLHRPEYYDRSDQALRGKAEIIVAKQREGETKTCHCTYQGAIMRWEDTKEHGAQQTSLDDGYFIDPPAAPTHGGDRIKW